MTLAHILSGTPKWSLAITAMAEWCSDKAAFILSLIQFTGRKGGGGVGDQCCGIGIGREGWVWGETWEKSKNLWCMCWMEVVTSHAALWWRALFLDFQISSIVKAIIREICHCCWASSKPLGGSSTSLTMSSGWDNTSCSVLSPQQAENRIALAAGHLKNTDFRSLVCRKHNLGPRYAVWSWDFL